MNKIIKNAFIDELQKIAASQLSIGTAVEEEHKPTVDKIRASVKGGIITMSNKDIFASIAHDHISEKDNPKHRGEYYTLLKKYVDPGL